MTSSDYVEVAGIILNSFCDDSIVWMFCLSDRIFVSQQAEMFLGLTYKAIKSDIDSKRMAAFAKRLLQVKLLFVVSYFGSKDGV